MAEGFLRALGGDSFDVMSRKRGNAARSRGRRGHGEVGVDISGQETKAVSRFLGRRFSYVVTLCDREKEKTCPIFPGAIGRLQWDLEDPSQAWSREERRAALRRVREDIQQRVTDFMKKAGESGKGATGK